MGARSRTDKGIMGVDDALQAAPACALGHLAAHAQPARYTAEARSRPLAAARGSDRTDDDPYSPPSRTPPRRHAPAHIPWRGDGGGDRRVGGRCAAGIGLPGPAAARPNHPFAPPRPRPLPPKSASASRAGEAALLARIDAEVGGAPCSSSTQCRTLPIGAKACGGPAGGGGGATPTGR